MKKIKAASLVISLVAFLSLVTFSSPSFAYYFGYTPTVGGTCTGAPASVCPPPGISIGGARARVGSNGLDRYFNLLVALGINNLATL
jgi:hypothetical protein